MAAAGLVTTLVGELQDIRYARPRETAAVAPEHADVVVGVKVRLGERGLRRRTWPPRSTRRCEAAELAGVR